MIGLTAKQSQLLSFLRFYIDENGGVSPSFEEMRDAVGLKAKSGIHRLISGLEERGLIRRIPNRARAIELVNDRPSLATVPTDDLLAELARRGLAPLRPDPVATRSGRNLPGPPAGTQYAGGAGLSVQPVHAGEVFDA